MTEPTQRTEADALNELRVKLERDMITANARNAELVLKLRGDLATATQRIAELESRIGPIDPGGGDKIDELESCIGFLRHDKESLQARVKQLEGAISLSLEGVTCPRCQGNGELWADGKEHYATHTGPTVACPACSGEGSSPIDRTILEQALSPSPPAVDTASKCPECGTNHGCLCDDAPPVQTEEKPATVPWWVKRPCSPETTDAHDCVRCGASMSLSADGEWDERPEYNFCHNCAHALVDECMEKLAATVPLAVAEGQWISVSDRMPDQHVTVLTMHEKDLYPVCAFRLVAPSGEVWIREIEGPEDLPREGKHYPLFRPPTHWMPLPPASFQASTK